MDGLTDGGDRDLVARTDRRICLPYKALCALVEAQRRRLGKADAILASLCVALDHADNIEANGTQFSLVAEAARDLIATSVECLDSARLEGNPEANEHGERDRCVVAPPAGTT